MKRLSIFIILFLTGCGLEPIEEGPCGFSGISDLYYDLAVTNNTNNIVEYGYAALEYRVGSTTASIRVRTISSSNAISVNLNSGDKAQFTFFAKPECYHDNRSTSRPPPADKEVYYVWFIRLIGGGQMRNYVAVGGSRENYESIFLTNTEYLAAFPSGSEVLGYNFLYIPGTIRRSLLGLERPYNAHGMYSDIDTSRRTMEYRSWPHLHLTINGTSKDDLLWSIR